jgi:hypothetical protein
MKAIFKPSEARAFAKMLDDKSNELRAINSEVSRLLLDLHSNSWKDQKYVEFERLLDQTGTRLHLFFERAEKYAEYLRKKANIAEKYLDRHYR